MEYRQLYGMKEKPSLLGFGCMRLPLLPGGGRGDIDYDRAQSMIDDAIANGVNYFDTAYGYLDGQSEIFVGKALKKYPRDSFYLASKLPMGQIDSYEKGIEIFNHQFEKLQVEYIDFYMFHGINKTVFTEKVLKFGLLDEMRKMKESGRIRNLGFSFHGSYEDFEYIMNYCDWDFCQIQYNYMDTEIQAGDRGVALAAERKVPLIIMEPVKGGSLASFAPAAEKIFKDYAPEKSLASWAVRWVAAHPGVAVVLSGMSTEEQVKDNLETFNHYVPLNAEEQGVIDQVVAAIRSSIRNGCTGCNYCMPCPFGVDIPRNFSIWNDYGMYNNAGRAKDNLNRLDADKWANKCAECGACEAACPQALPIREDLKKMFAEISAL
ncbi:MAG: aldo/keto reductase [Ruminococcaceae bacterium]|nr:aldo/keto reductase [Oscillospiraceae bacterium]